MFKRGKVEVRIGDMNILVIEDKVAITDLQPTV